MQNRRVKPYSHLNYVSQKEITKNYIDGIIIFFEKKGFKAELKKKK
jgi:hypothetical protein